MAPGFCSGYLQSSQHITQNTLSGQILIVFVGSCFVTAFCSLLSHRSYSQWIMPSSDQAGWSEASLFELLSIGSSPAPVLEASASLTKSKILQEFTRADGQVNVANQTQQPCEQKHGIEVSSSCQRVHGVRTPLKLSKHAQGAANQKVDLCLAVALLSLICDMPENVSWVVCSFKIVSSPNTQKVTQRLEPCCAESLCGNVCRVECSHH